MQTAARSSLGLAYDVALFVSGFRRSMTPRKDMFHSSRPTDSSLQYINSRFKILAVAEACGVDYSGSARDMYVAQMPLAKFHERIGPTHFRKSTRKVRLQCASGEGELRAGPWHSHSGHGNIVRNPARFYHKCRRLQRRFDEASGCKHWPSWWA